MLAAVDVQYRDPRAAAACVTFDAWDDAESRSEHVVLVDDVAEYVPGEFWRRELPCILQVLELVNPLPGVIVIDGHVWLDGSGRKGLGAHLYDALEGHAAVIGVAKSGFCGLSGHAEVLRGDSRSPLFVTSVGYDGDAAGRIRAMHGANRVPTLLRRVDQLCRARAKERD